jgi:molybdopterin-guanine dinucleotide biosynthesis protein B
MATADVKTCVIGIVGYKDNGKTTLAVRLVEHLTRAGYRVSTVKHAHHQADIDQPGRDSWRHREAGATDVMLSTGRRWMMVHELRGEPEPALEEHRISQRAARRCRRRAPASAHSRRRAAAH